jgi:hypothetical protein
LNLPKEIKSFMLSVIVLYKRMELYLAVQLNKHTTVFKFTISFTQHLIKKKSGGRSEIEIKRVASTFDSL